VGAGHRAVVEVEAGMKAAAAVVADGASR